MVNKVLYYIPQIIFFVALVVIIWILVKNLPKARKLEVSEIMGNIEDEFDDFVESEKKIFKNIQIEKVDAHVNSLLEKILRKVRINTIKFDNHLQKAITSIKNGSKPTKTIFKSDDDGKEELEDNKKDEKVLDLKVEADPPMPKATADQGRATARRRKKKEEKD